MAQTLDIPIGELVPHDPPMILIDAMVEADKQHNICTVAITEDSMFLEEGVVPAFVGIEYMAQAIAAHGGYLARLAGEPVRVGFLLGTPRLVCHVAHFPLGARLRVEVTQDWGDEELMRFCCKIIDETTDKVLQEAGLNVFHPRDLVSYLTSNRGG